MVLKTFQKMQKNWHTRALRAKCAVTHIPNHQGCNNGDTIPRVPDHYGGAKCLLGAPKSPNNFTSTFFSTGNFLAKDIRFEHWGAKLAPGAV